MQAVDQDVGQEYDSVEPFTFEDADVVLLSKDRLVFALHKSNLSRSSVFRDMFDSFERTAGQSAIESTTPSGGRKRQRLTEVETGENLEYIAMEESHQLLALVLPLFYDMEKRSVYEFNAFPYPNKARTDEDVLEEDPTSIQKIARFIDKFDLEKGKLALFVSLQWRLAALEKRRKSWESTSWYFYEALAIYFIIIHFKLKSIQEETVLLLIRIEAARLSQNRDLLREAVFAVTDSCFGDHQSANELYERLINHILRIDASRNKLEPIYLSKLVQAANASRRYSPSRPSSYCPGNGSIHQDWLATKRIVSAKDFDLAEPKEPGWSPGWSQCTCAGACETLRRKLFAAFSQELRNIDREEYTESGQYSIW